MSELPTTDEEWRVQLDPAAFQVLRMGATEPAFTGKYVNDKRQGTYRCAGCGAHLFSSTTKYESGSGWPSFYEPVGDGAIGERRDTSHGMIRTEIVCNRCGGHLGHVFEDGPRPTGLRYCVNSAALDLEESN